MTKLRLESEIRTKQDSLKVIDQKINQLQSQELINKLQKQPEGMVYKATVSMSGKIRKKPDPISTGLIGVNPSDTVFLTGFDGIYWIVNKERFFGYINDMYIVNTPDLEKFRKIVSDRDLKMRIQMEELERKKAAEDQRKESEKKRVEAEKRRTYLIKKYGKELGESIYAGKFWIGMSSEMAIESLGRPETINKSVGSWGVHEQEL